MWSRQLPHRARRPIDAGVAIRGLAPLGEMRWNEAMREAGSPQGDDGFVGRGDHVRELRSLVEDAASGRGGVVIVGGEAGVGKTRFVEHVLSGTDVHRAGRVLWARARETSAPSLWPWTQLARAAQRAGIDGLAEIVSADSAVGDLDVSR